MTLQEVQKTAYEGAFYDWVTIEDAKKVGLIPEEFHKYFSDKCSCGSEFIIKKSITKMMCCDFHCSVKLGYRIAEMFHRFGIKGLQESSCRKIYEMLILEDKRQRELGNPPLMEYDSYLSVLTVPWDSYPYSIRNVKGAEFYNACKTVLSRRLTFQQLISCLAIPDLNEGARKLFAEYSSFEEALIAIKQAGSITRFCNFHGIESVSVIYSLRNSLEDIYVASQLFSNSLRECGRIPLSVCMTGSIIHNGIRTTKDKYLARCNQLVVDSRGIQIFEISMNAAIESNPFILYSNPSGDRKYVAGANRGVIVDDYGEHPVLLHVDKFYNFLERVMEKWNQALELKPSSTLNMVLLEILPETMSEVLKG